MRPIALPLALILAAASTVAGAQVQQNDPNAANAALARQGEVRALNQQRVSDFNTLNMQIQRDARAPAYAPYRGVNVHPPLSHGATGPRVRGRGGLNTSICIGC